MNFTSVKKFDVGVETLIGLDCTQELQQPLNVYSDGFEELLQQSLSVYWKTIFSVKGSLY